MNDGALPWLLSFVLSDAGTLACAVVFCDLDFCSLYFENCCVPGHNIRIKDNERKVNVFVYKNFKNNWL